MADIGKRKIYDQTGDNVIVISYAPGSFGNFLLLALTEFAGETVKANNENFTFGENGNSHNVVKYAQQYRQENTYNPWINNGIDFENKKIVLKADNGLANPGLDKIKETFPNATIVRVAVDDSSKLLALHLFEGKVKGRPVPENAYDYLKIQGNLKLVEQWSMIREDKICNVQLSELVLNPAQTIKSLITRLGLTIINVPKLTETCAAWEQANSQYISAFKAYKS